MEQKDCQRYGGSAHVELALKLERGMFRNGTSAQGFHESGNLDGLLDRLLVPDSLTPAQLSSPSNWSPEKRLAGAVLAAALVGIRDHCHNPAYRTQVVEDLEWLSLTDNDWPFSFLSICQVFDLDPAWVRAQVRHWMGLHPERSTCTSIRPFHEPALASTPARRTTHAALA